MIIKTYLYIKEHSLTGLKYLGKTANDPYKYSGSGKHWMRHIKKHGKEHIKTLWVSEPFTNKDLLVEFATFMSQELNIVNSDKWANLIVENGLDGAPKGVSNSGPFGIKNGMYGKTGENNPFSGKQHTIKQKLIWSEMRLGNKNPNYGGKAFTQETLLKLRKPKPNKENYKGSPGKMCCINKEGKSIQIDKQIYHDQKISGIEAKDWEYVNTNSKEAKNRKETTDFMQSL